MISKTKLTTILAIIMVMCTVLICTGCGNTEGGNAGNGDSGYETAEDNDDYRGVTAFGSDLEIGDTVEFGKWNTVPIQWNVLDKTEDGYLLICKYCEHYSAYVDSGEQTWENSKVREFLNGRFYDMAFTDKQKEYISETEVTTNESGDAQGFSKDYYEVVTLDNVFILSVDEALQYFDSNEARVARANEKFVESQDLQSEVYDDGTVNWWLRSTTDYTPYASSPYVAADSEYNREMARCEPGAIQADGCGNNSGEWIRPVIWVKYEGK